MPRKTQRERGSAPLPLRLRVAALLCVLLVSVAGIAQAAHIHGDLLPKLATQVGAHVALNGPAGELDCPLCIAMHSALPVAGFAALVAGLLLDSTLLLASSRKPRTLWYFAAFSRPPPIL